MCSFGMWCFAVANKLISFVFWRFASVCFDVLYSALFLFALLRLAPVLSSKPPVLERKTTARLRVLTCRSYLRETFCQRCSKQLIYTYSNYCAGLVESLVDCSEPEACCHAGLSCVVSMLPSGSESRLPVLSWQTVCNLVLLRLRLRLRPLL